MMNDPTIELTNIEERVLTYFAFSQIGRLDLLLKAMAISQEEWDAAEKRLLSVGFIEPSALRRQ